MTVTVYGLDARVPTIFTNIDRISYVNHESYGPHEKIRGSSFDDEKILIVNVNNFVAVLIDDD